MKVIKVKMKVVTVVIVDKNTQETISLSRYQKITVSHTLSKKGPFEDKLEINLVEPTLFKY